MQQIDVTNQKCKQQIILQVEKKYQDNISDTNVKSVRNNTDYYTTWFSSHSLDISFHGEVNSTLFGIFMVDKLFTNAL